LGGFCAVLVLSAIGCASSGEGAQGGRAEPESLTYRQEARTVLGDLGAMPQGASTKSSDVGVDGTPTEQAGSWSVLIAQFPATGDGQARAARSLALVRSTGGLPSAYLERRDDSIAMLVGRHGSVQDARRELTRVRSTLVQNERPYSGAVLAPPFASLTGGSMPEFDLRRVRARMGPDALYTLQVGVYGRIDGSRPDADELAEYRRAAEQAVAQLRGDGEEAYFYHGPTQSTVTVGVFGPADHDPSKGTRGESATLRRAREAHPNNLLNGKGIRETHRDTSGRPARTLQRARLVSIPD